MALICKFLVAEIDGEQLACADVDLNDASFDVTRHNDTATNVFGPMRLTLSDGTVREIPKGKRVRLIVPR